MEAPIYNKSAKETGKLTLSEKVFGLKWNADLVHQVVTAMQANARQGNAHTKGRGEVRGGGKKPWRQKGTGRARHGSRRSPIWVGGGMTHGPTSEKDYSQKINKKMKTKALHTLLSRKFTDGDLIFVDDLGLTAAKTKAAVSVIKAFSAMPGKTKMGYKTGKRVLVALPNNSEATVKSFRNIASVEVREAREINPLLLATYQYVVVTNPEASLPLLTDR